MTDCRSTCHFGQCCDDPGCPWPTTEDAVRQTRARHEDAPPTQVPENAAKFQQWQRLLDIYESMNTHERAVLIGVAQRIRAGRRAYGELDLRRDKRNFRREASQEAADQLVYLVADDIREDWAG